MGKKKGAKVSTNRVCPVCYSAESYYRKLSGTYCCRRCGGVWSLDVLGRRIIRDSYNPLTYKTKG